MSNCLMELQAVRFSEHLPALRARAQCPWPRIPPSNQIKKKITIQPSNKAKNYNPPSVEQSKSDISPRHGMYVDGMALVAPGQLHELHPSTATTSGAGGGERGIAVDVGPTVRGEGAVVGDSACRVDDVADGADGGAAGRAQPGVLGTVWVLDGRWGVGQH